MGETWKNIKKRLDPLNLKKGKFRSDDNLGIPLIKNTPVDVEKLIIFGQKYREGTGHFFMNDWTFERVWNKPKMYLPMVKSYTQGICSPDFSLFGDWPLIVNLWQLYRNRWCGRYWQVHGVNVIPTICWIGEESYDWRFLGVEKGSMVAVSTVGVLKQDKYKEGFIDGYEAMLKELNPSKVVWYGEPIAEYTPPN